MTATEIRFTRGVSERVHAVVASELEEHHASLQPIDEAIPAAFLADADEQYAAHVHVMHRSVENAHRARKAMRALDQQDSSNAHRAERIDAHLTSGDLARNGPANPLPPPCPTDPRQSEALPPQTPARDLPQFPLQHTDSPPQHHGPSGVMSPDHFPDGWMGRDNNDLKKQWQWLQDLGRWLI